MAGLMSQRESAEQRKPMPASRGTPDTQDEAPNVSPEEQAQYDALIENGAALIYNEQAMPQLIETIRGDGNPTEGLANAAVAVWTRIEDSAEKEGATFTDDAKLHAGKDLMDMMAELAEQAGIEISEEDAENAWYLALDMYRAMRQQQGKIDEAGAQQEFAELQAAEQAGTIEEILPGVTEFARNAPQPPAQPAPQAQQGPARRPRGLMAA